MIDRLPVERKLTLIENLRAFVQEIDGMFDFVDDFAGTSIVDNALHGAVTSRFGDCASERI